MASLARPTLLRQAARLRPATGSFVKQQPSKASMFQQTARVAAFHATSRRNVLPPLPQKIEGTINDPVPVPTPSPSHGSYHWTFERLIALGLVPLTIAPFASGSLNPILDAVLCGTLLVHCHVGFQSIIIDYIPIKRMPTARKAFWWALNAATALVGVGLYEFETNDVGITEAIKRIWQA